MKLNKIAVAVLGLLAVATSPAWSYTGDPADPGAVAQSTPSLVVADPSVGVVGTTLTDAAGTTATATRTDVGSGTTKKVTTFTTTNPAAGQGTIGGLGGVSGLGVATSAVTTYAPTTTTTYVAAGTLAVNSLGAVYKTPAPTAAIAGATVAAGTTIASMGGAVAAGTAIPAGTVIAAGDVIVTANTTKLSATTIYAAGTSINGVVHVAGVGDAYINADGTAVAAAVTTGQATLASDKTIVASGATNGAITNAAVGTGIKGTDHDFTKGATYNGGTTVGLCTYCHTPHKGTSTLLLWNKTMSTNTFQWDVSATTAGTALPGFIGNTYKGPSAKCLACHDGSVAIGDIGWFNQSVRNTSGTFLSSAKITSAAKLMAATGNAAGNLTGVHPVAVPYPLNGAPNVYNASTTGAQLATADFVTDPTVNNIRLYSDLGGGQIVGKVTSGKTGIECSSCHDVHNKAATDRFFLRGKLVGSSVADGYICVQCHTK